ncbi:MAG: S9 family peptidase [Firmicutes bacterium]|nr:S9 family peptidase [Bacillota bacterium]
MRLEPGEPGLEEFFQTFAISALAVDAAGRRVAFGSNLGGRFEVWGLDLADEACAYPFPLSRVGQVPHALRFDPQGRYLVVGLDRDGDERVQLSLLAPDGGGLTPLVQSTGARFDLVDLSPDGRYVYYSSDRDNPRFMDCYRLDLETGREERLFRGEGATTVFHAVAPDGSSLVLAQAYSNTRQPGFVWRAGERLPLTPDPDAPQVTWSAGYLDPDTILFTTTYGADRAYLARYSIPDRAFTPVLQREDADLAGLEIDRDGRRLWVIGQEGVADRLWEVNLADGTAAPDPELPVAVVDGMVTAGGALFVAGRSEVDPPNLWRRDPAGGWRRLTRNRVMGVEPGELVRAERIRYPSPDGRFIEGLWFEAPPGRANGYTILWPHGGPQAAERRQYRPFFQYALRRGYHLFAPNFRGSTGYGTAFAKLVERAWNRGPREDILAGLDYLEAQGRVTPGRVFVVGGSYGGYMTLLLHAFHGDRFAGFVDLFGPSDLITFAAAVPEFWKPMMREWLGDPEADRDRLAADSPIRYVDRMRKPMLVIQGANDPRVVRAESDRLVEALRAQGVAVEYLVFEDEGHGFTKKENEIRAYRAIL